MNAAAIPEGSNPENAFDWRQYKALLRVFFVLNRRGHMSQSFGKRDKDLSMVWIVLSYTLFGLMMGMVTLMSRDAAAILMVMHTFTMMMVIMVAIMESNQVLFNPQEEDVLGHRPISARTLLAAKITNMIGITMMVAVSLNLAPAFLLLTANGVRIWAPLVHLALIVPLLCCFCSSAVVFIFGLMARTVGRERFQTLVTWTQIVMMVSATIGYQFVGRMIGNLHLENIKALLPWLAPLPPVWFMGLEVTLATGQATMMTFGLGATALVVTAALGWAAAVRLAGLQGKISSSMAERAAPPVRAGSRPVAAARPMGCLLRAWLRDPVERAAFTLTAAMMRRERYIMQQVYPHLAFVIAYPLLMIFSTGGHAHNARQGPGHDTFTFILFGSWMLGTLPLTLLEILKTSERPEAAQIFAIAPLEHPGRLFHGVRKAVLFYVVLPVTLVLALIGFFFLRLPMAEALVALPILMILPTFSLIPGAGGLYLPFSLPAQRGNKAGRVTAVFGSMIVAGVLLLLSYLAQKVGWLHWLILAELPVVVLIHTWIKRRVARAWPIRIGE